MTVPVRTVHDAAHVTTLTVLECIENLIRPEEKETAYHELFHVIPAGLEAAFIFADRERQRMQPLAKGAPENN
jgi:hypothetical protein